MSGVLIHLTTLVALAVFGVLAAGLWNMARQGSSPSLSQTLMRWRVGLQFIAILIAIVAMAIARG
ncbi:MAG: twin transmembrane helix small protein [Hyphomicrobiaceae bacterium]|nr:twin transmembrane helix small protein [Hyphomicrobiaceae bacterium]